MFRLISILLVTAGVGALAFGSMQMLSGDPVGDQPAVGAGDMAPVPAPVMTGTPPTTAGLEVVAEDNFEAASTVEGGDVSIASADGDMMAQLRSVPIAHETPSKAQFGRAFDVSVAIDATGGQSAADALPGRGNVVTGKAKVSSKVQAALSGDAFEIEAVTPMVQTVSPLTENVWRWRVTPMERGAQPLIIEIFALNGNEALPVKTFRDEVVVEISRVGQAIALANSVSPVAMVLGGIGSLLAGLFGVARFFRSA